VWWRVPHLDVLLENKSEELMWLLGMWQKRVFAASYLIFVEITEEQHLPQQYFIEIFTLWRDAIFE